MITSLLDLYKRLKQWIQYTIPEDRLKSDIEGRKWFIYSLGYSKTLKLEDLKTVTDREELNIEYIKRYKVIDVKKRQGISALKAEISALYSFNKCFVQRYKGRLHYYRDDLSQKGTRNMVSVGQAVGLFNEFKKNLA
jgi:hypothetical protein